MRKTAVITGTTSGIGKALCHEFAKNGINLVLISRDSEKLEKQKEELQRTYEIFVDYILRELSEKEAAVFVYQKIKDMGVQIDYLVNNAGFRECFQTSR